MSCEAHRFAVTSLSCDLICPFVISVLDLEIYKYLGDSEEEQVADSVSIPMTGKEDPDFNPGVPVITETKALKEVPPSNVSARPKR